MRVLLPVLLVLGPATGVSPASAAAADRSAASDPRTIAQRIERLERELRRAGRDTDRVRLERALADLHVIEGRALAGQGDLDGARTAYGRALSYAPDHLVALIEAGWLAVADERLGDAGAHVATGLALAPDDARLLVLRGEIAYRENRLRDALADFERARAARPDDRRLAGRLAKVRRELAAEARFDRADSSHFELRYEGERAESLGAAILDLLEDSLESLAGELDAWLRAPVTVILYTERQFRETTRSGPEVAGLFDGKIRLPVAGLDGVTPGLRRVVRHELVHALLHRKSLGRAPRWLHEGLAQFLEPRDPRRVEAAVALSIAREGGGLEPFSYPRALAFVAWLDGEYSRARLLHLVDLLAEGLSENDAFVGAFGSSRQEIVDQWVRTLDNPR